MILWFGHHRGALLRCQALARPTHLLWAPQPKTPQTQASHDPVRGLGCFHPASSSVFLAEVLRQVDVPSISLPLPLFCCLPPLSLCAFTSVERKNLGQLVLLSWAGDSLPCFRRSFLGPCQPSHSTAPKNLSFRPPHSNGALPRAANPPLVPVEESSPPNTHAPRRKLDKPQARKLGSLLDARGSGNREVGRAGVSFWREACPSQALLLS